MRVLFVSHTVLMAGANRSMFQLMLELRDRYQIEPVVVMPRIHKNYEKWNLFKACQEQNIECYTYRFYWFKDTGRLVNYVRLALNLFCYPYIRNKLKGRSYDIIHSNGSVIDLGGYLSMTMKIPHVWHLREFGWLDFHLKSLLGTSYEKCAYSQGDVFIAISQAVMKCYQNVIPRQKLQLIYNGVVPPPENLEAKHQNEKVQFCMVGVVSEAKNQLEALKAIDLLVNKWKYTQFHLTLIGFEEPIYAHKLHSFINNCHLSDYVTMMGERHDVKELLSKMDVGLMLSQNEAFGRVTVEYMMQNLAVIASDSGANLEIVEDGKSGRIYELGHEEHLAEIMKYLLDNEQDILKYAENGKERAMKNFTSIQNTEQVYKVYQSLLSV